MDFLQTFVSRFDVRSKVKVVNRTEAHSVRVSRTLVTLQTGAYTLCFIKNRIPKAGRHKFIKISSPKMIFHTVHCHSVADSLCYCRSPCFLLSVSWQETRTSSSRTTHQPTEHDQQSNSCVMKRQVSFHQTCGRRVVRT